MTTQYPSLNVLINNAGMMRPENLREKPDDLSVAEDTVTTNLLGPIRLTSALLPLLQIQPRAAVMNVSSGLAFVPLAMTPTYCATKAAIHSYTQSLRYQLKDTKVEVIELIPPYVAATLMGNQQANDPNTMPLDGIHRRSHVDLAKPARRQRSLRQKSAPPSLRRRRRPAKVRAVLPTI